MTDDANSVDDACVIVDCVELIVGSVVLTAADNIDVAVIDGVVVDFVVVSAATDVTTRSIMHASDINHK